MVWSKNIIFFSCCDIQMFQHNLLRNLSFLHCFFSALSNDWHTIKLHQLVFYKGSCWDFDWIALNIESNLGIIGILVLGFSISEQSISLSLLGILSSLLSLFCNFHFVYLKHILWDLYLCHVFCAVVNGTILKFLLTLYYRKFYCCVLQFPTVYLFAPLTLWSY